MCVSSLIYPGRKARAPHCIVICALSGCTAYFHIILQKETIFGKNVIEHKMCIISSLQLLTETLLILRRTEIERERERDA